MVKSKSTKLYDWVIVFICLLVILLCLLPLVNIVARSLSSAEAMVKNQVLLWPEGLSFKAYTAVLGDSKVTWALLWTAILTVVTTVWCMFMTILCAYPLIYDNLKGRKLILALILFTMYFNAGIIPTYLLLKGLHLLNNPLVLILPGSISVFNVIIMRSFFFGIPESLRESAELDGAGPLRVLVNVYLPLSMPVLATLSLFYAVGRWNGFSDALMFMSDRDYYPIQLLLFNILNSISSVEVATQEGFTSPGLSESIKAATVVFATVPILLIYPWLQRYFISGVTIGAVKG